MAKIQKKLIGYISLALASVGATMAIFGQPLIGLVLATPLALILATALRKAIEITRDGGGAS